MTLVESVPPTGNEFPTHLVANVPVSQKPGMHTYKVSVDRYLRHAKLIGTHLVFETAYDCRDLTALELAELASGLIKIQRTPRPGWHEGQPLERNRRTGKVDTIPDQSRRSPKGILGDRRDPLIAALIQDKVPYDKIVKLLSVKRSQVADVQSQLQLQESDDYEGEVLVPYYRITIPGEGGGTSEVEFAESESAAKKQTREKLGIGRLPAGSTVTEVKAPKGAWRDLPDPEKVAYLLEHPTIPDHAWTEEKREPGESRTDFLRRVIGPYAS